MNTSPNRFAVLAVVAVAALALVPSNANAVTTATLANTIDTSVWAHPSPDPMGMTYKKKGNTIIVVDSEVEETIRWTNVNVWYISPSGTTRLTWKTTRFSNEPTDVAIKGGKTLFITDDDNSLIYVVRRGADNKFGTADDIVDHFSTKAFGSLDPQGLTFALNNLWLTDREGAAVYRIAPGPNKKFDGVGKGDDVVTHFSTTPLGLTEPSDAAFDPATGHLFLVSQADLKIVEATKDGALLNTIDISASGIVSPSGIVLAPGSVDTTATHVYVSDRGIDNDFIEGGNPNENDGKIFEFALS